MPQAALPRIAPSPFCRLPFEVEHKSSRTAAAVQILLLLPVVAMVVLPIALVLTFASHDLWEAVAHKPLPATILGAGLVAWLGLLLIPAKRLILDFGNRRRVKIGAERIMVDDKGLFRSSHWSAPLAEFSGIAHHVRATLSGVRHELILVHPVRDRSVLLLAADAIGQSTIEQAAHLFRLPQVPAHPLHRIAQRDFSSSVVEALTGPQTA
jgi:hypothetical protein